MNFLLPSNYMKYVKDGVNENFICFISYGQPIGRRWNAINFPANISFSLKEITKWLSLKMRKF